MTADPKHHIHLVASRGDVWRRNGDEFDGARVAGDRINLKDCIDDATARINEITKHLEDMVIIDCETQQTYHRTVGGVTGSIVQKMTTDLNVPIKLPDKAHEKVVINGDRSPNPSVIQITGKKEDCGGASKALLELVAITAEIFVPNEFNRDIIGQKSIGNGVRGMMNRCDVNFRAPDQTHVEDDKIIADEFGKKGAEEVAMYAIRKKREHSSVSATIINALANVAVNRIDNAEKGTRMADLLVRLLELFAYLSDEGIDIPRISIKKTAADMLERNQEILRKNLEDKFKNKKLMSKMSEKAKGLEGGETD